MRPLKRHHTLQCLRTCAWTIHNSLFSGTHRSIPPSSPTRQRRGRRIFHWRSVPLASKYTQKHEYYWWTLVFGSQSKLGNAESLHSTVINRNRQELLHIVQCQCTHHKNLIILCYWERLLTVASRCLAFSHWDMDSISVGQDYSSNPQKPGEYKGLSSVDLGRKKYKLRMLFCSACLGKPRVHSKSRSKHQRSTQTRWNHLGNIDQLWEDAHFGMDAIYGFIDAGSIAHGPELRKGFGIIQEIWIWEHQRFVRNYKNDDWRKCRNKECISIRRCEFTLGKTCIVWRTSNKVDKSKSVRLLRPRVMLGKTAQSRRCNKKVEWSSVNFEDVSHLQRIARIRWRSDWPRVENLPRSQSIGHSPQNSSRPTRKEHHTWKYSGRIIFMSMFNDTELERKDNEDSCALTSRKNKKYASKFNDGHWAFLGPGEESKWYQGYAAEFGGKWDLRASQMVETVENSGHPVFQGVSPLGRGILKKRNNRETVHFNGEHGNINLLYRTVHAANQLCIHGAVSKWCGPKSGESSQSRSVSARKMSPEFRVKQEDLKSLFDIPRLPYASEKPTAPEFGGSQFDAIYEQNWISPHKGEIPPSDRERKQLCCNCSWWWRMEKAHFDVQRIYSAQKPRGFKAIRINWCRKRNWSSLWILRLYNYWCSWYWSASTITEFTRILRMDFHESWSRKICEWNSSP